MSSSPKRFYASRRNSKDTSPPASTPPSNAEVRSQAIAKLKRAASLPRTSAGRRPPPVNTGNTPQEDQGGSAVSPPIQPDITPVYPSLAHHVPQSPEERQEVLSPSPVNERFDHTMMYNNYTSPPSAFLMQRSASEASSYHMPTPPHMGSYPSTASAYFGSPPSANTPDWAAMQLASSYLPSLSPAGAHQPGFAVASSQPGIGRNTPSPLPTLGELRTLQRSNSAMARAHAMDKLTGGSSRGASRAPTPAEEDRTIQSNPAGLQRADTVGAKILLKRAEVSVGYEDEKKEDKTLAPSRPRLQRSFTVSGSNMGEERRSAVGRRMVARLGARRAARQHEEEEVRRLWEERRAAAEGHRQEDELGDQTGPDHEASIHTEDSRGESDNREHLEAEEVRHGQSADREVLASDTSLPARSDVSGPVDALGVPLSHDRPISGTTMRSEAFEYDNLRRSLSSRTARKEMGIMDEAVPMIDRRPSAEADRETGNTLEQIYEQQGIHQALEAPLRLPRPAFATPSRHAPHDSTSTDTTIQAGHSPGDSIASRDALGSMMFVMGGNAANHGREQSIDNWPSEVGDQNGSDWGTPNRDQHQPTFHDDSPLARSPFVPVRDELPTINTGNLSPQSPSAHSPDDLTPPDASQRTSVMSWEEVGGPDDQAVPSDVHYHKKSGSISAKIGRNIRTAMRKRSHSRSSISSSTDGVPASPKALTVAVQNFSRRGSESSLSPSQASAFARGSPQMPSNDQIRHQPSMTSLSPSLPSQPESSANSILLQHQLSNDPQSVGWLPRADLSDPRIHNTKLSPFPGIAHLEKKGDAMCTDKPKLVHQVSDSVIPSQQRVIAEAGPESIYSLPLPSQSSADSRRASDDSVGKRNWLAKAFGQGASPRTSGGTSHSRHPSTADLPLVVTPYSPPNDNHQYTDSDPFAGPSVAVSKPSRHRSHSPAVSVVPEVSEEGSRLTRFTAHTRLDNASPAIPEVEEAGQRELPPTSKEILSRMDDLLSMGPDDPARPDILDDPPRKLLLATQVLQVVNVNTAKDRFLFLFNDLLVITKPFINQGHIATLDMRFMVKSVVSLDKLQISGFEEESLVDPPRHAVVQSFIEQFAQDPVAACKYLMDRSNPRVDPITLASLIFKTPELDRAQIGKLLAGNELFMRVFMDRFHFSGLRIDEALRMFLLAVRLPTEATASETLLRGLAYRYYEANRDVVGFSREQAEDAINWILQLNDTLHGVSNQTIPFEAVLSAFRSKYPNSTHHEDCLAGTYHSIAACRIDQALTNEHEQEYGRDIMLTPSKIPSKLTYNIWSDPITVTIPEADDGFTIKLLGEGLEFEPDILDFSVNRQQTFRVKGLSLGVKSISFFRLGRNATLYGRLGNGRTLTVERAFMRHTFHVTFTSHTGLKRKYCFSVPDAKTRAKWAAHLYQQIAATTNAKKPTGENNREKIRNAAELVSLQVLRDALISPEEKSDVIGIKRPQRRSQRSGSVSITYPALQGREESELGPLVPGKATDRATSDSGMVDVNSGKELVLLCRQNSLLPGILELLQAGIPDPRVEADGPYSTEQYAQPHSRLNEVVMGRTTSKRGGTRV